MKKEKIYLVVTTGDNYPISKGAYKDLMDNLAVFYNGRFDAGGIMYCQEFNHPNAKNELVPRKRPMWHYPEEEISIFLDQICLIYPIYTKETQ